MKPINQFRALALLTALGVGLSQNAQALTVTPTSSATTLSGAIVSGGISIVGAPTYTADTTNGSGLFSGGLASGIGIDKGILLTTGLATNAIGPNNASNKSGGGTFSRLAFNFTSAGGDLFFNYVFASEEYNEYVGSAYNDLFTLKIDGVNVALIPSTAIPVTINNVNLGSNAAYYVNNSPGSANIQYDGFTTVLTAKALGLSAGSHSFEAYIQDVGDSSYDSGVFIQADSFSDIRTSTVPDGGSSIALLGMALGGIGWIRRKMS